MKTNSQKNEEGILNLDCVSLTPEILGEIQSIQEDLNNDDLARLEKIFNFLFGIYQSYSDDFVGEEKTILDHLSYIKDLQAHFEIFKIKQTSIVASVPKELISPLKILN